MIRPARADEIDQALEITRACAREMISRGIFQWNEYYPSREVFEKDLKRSELYVLEENEQIPGIIVISSLKDEIYEEVDWLTPSDAKSVYIHRLAVHPDFQGKGYAQKLLSFAEAKARHEGYESVRLDTFSQNRRNQLFYEQRGYQRLGDIYFPKQSEHPFYCYELVL